MLSCQEFQGYLEKRSEDSRSPSSTTDGGLTLLKTPSSWAARMHDTTSTFATLLAVIDAVQA